MNPRFPLYIVSKGRHDTRMTAKALEAMNVPYRIVVEEQERDLYASVIDPRKVLVLDPQYQRDYDTFDDLGDSKSKGPGPARNFVWEHSMAEGHPWHWVMDDNIRIFYRLNRNSNIPVGDGTCFRVMEDFCLRYKNIGMAGPNYYMFVPRKERQPVFIRNTRIYSCNLIRNDTPFRWRGRYNEDTDLSLRMLKSGWCTIQFNAFLQCKMMTQKVKGGNTAEFYAKEGTYPKSKMLVDMHPDVARLSWKFQRAHHHVDYRPFRELALIRRDDVEIPDEVNEYGLRTIDLSDAS
jgi:hypothetical protein